MTSLGLWGRCAEGLDWFDPSELSVFEHISFWRNLFGRNLEVEDQSEKL